MGTARVYVVAGNAENELVACRYVEVDEFADWLRDTLAEEAVRCDVYDEAPESGGHRVTGYVRETGSWEATDTEAPMRNKR